MLIYICGKKSRLCGRRMEVGECDRGDREVFWQRQKEVGPVVVVDKPQLSTAHHSLLT